MGYKQVRQIFVAYLINCMFIFNIFANDISSPQLPPYDDYNNYNDEYDTYTPDFTPGGTFCQEKRTCGSTPKETFPGKSCYCDDVCNVLEDCCWDKKSKNNVTTALANYSKTQFLCIERPELLKNTKYGIAVIDKCSSSWNEVNYMGKCENAQNLTDILLHLPVSEIETNVMFKNVYCALCNFVYDFKVWKAEMKCPNGTNAYDNLGNPDCKISFITPDPTIKARQCSLDNIIDQCLPSVTDEELKQNCTNGDYSIVYDTGSSIFRNSYCAYCNGLNSSDESVSCEEHIYSTIAPPPIDPKTYSFKVLVDFNTRTNEGTIDRETNNCLDDEIFDPFTESCRQIVCMYPYIARQGRCEQAALTLNETTNDPLGVISNSTFLADCMKLAKFNATEFEITNGTDVFIFSLNKAFREGDYLKSGSDVFICLERNQICLQFCNPAQEMFTFTKAENILTLICLIISLIALFVTFLVYVCFPQLLNTPGKILISLVVCLFLAQLLFLISSEVNTIPELCQALGIIVHFFFLAAFCWMNIIALDLWMTFSNQFVSMGSGKSSKRLFLYTTYAWLTPFVIVLVAVILDNVDFDNKYESLKPKYGNGVCWITSRDALILFFAGPLALFKLFDIVSFIFTAMHIIKAKRQGAMATHKKNACSFFINLKLSLVMGLTWVFAFVANVANIPSFWYLFIIFNALQGLFICLSFMCTKKVTRILKEKYEIISKSGDSSASTQLTSYQRKTGAI